MCRDYYKGNIFYPLSLNEYIYVLNDPVNWVDPLGLFKKDSSGNIIAHSVGDPITIRHPSRATANSQPVILYADDGTTIDAYKYISGDPGMETDCHGVTFGDSQYWINNDQVDKILKGDNYTSTTTPNVGDVLIYRDLHGNVQHSVTVTGVGPNGTVTNVTGLGGIEIETTTTTPSAAWNRPSTLHYCRP